MSECLVFTDENFRQKVFGSSLPVFVDFWGSWCPPCKMMEPVMEELAQEFAGKVTVGKLNVDQNPATRLGFGISAAPTFILFKDGKILKRAIGSQSRKQLVRMITKSLGSVGAEQPVRTLTSIPPEKQQRTDTLERI